MRSFLLEPRHGVPPKDLGIDVEDPIRSALARFTSPTAKQFLTDFSERLEDIFADINGLKYKMNNDLSLSQPVSVTEVSREDLEIYAVYFAYGIEQAHRKGLISDEHPTRVKIDPPSYEITPAINPSSKDIEECLPKIKFAPLSLVPAYYNFFQRDIHFQTGFFLTRIYGDIYQNNFRDNPLADRSSSLQFIHPLNQVAVLAYEECVHHRQCSKNSLLRTMHLLRRIGEVTFNTVFPYRQDSERHTFSSKDEIEALAEVEEFVNEQEFEWRLYDEKTKKYIEPSAEAIEALLKGEIKPPTGFYPERYRYPSIMERPLWRKKRFPGQASQLAKNLVKDFQRRTFLGKEK